MTSTADGSNEDAPGSPGEEPSNRGNPHVPGLDGIRGLAVLLVFVFHVFQAEPTPGGLAARLGYQLTRFGQTGVDLFFVLSGFLITGILYDARGSRSYYRNFYARRVLRIFPLYFGFAFLIIEVLPRLAGIRGTDLTWTALGTFSANFAMTAGVRGGLLGHFWSLAIEEQFYLLWPFVVAFFDRKSLLRICAVGIALAACGRWIVESRGISSFMVTPCRMDQLLVGSFLALAQRGPGGLRGWLRWLGPLGTAAVAMALVLTPALRDSRTAWPQVIKYPLLAVPFAALIVLAVAPGERSRIARVLERPFLRWLGKHSYGLYVYHPPLIVLLGWLSARFAPGIAPDSGFSVVGAGLRFGLVSVLSCAAAWLSWTYFESPILRLKRYFEYAPASDPGEKRPLQAGRDDVRISLWFPGR